MADDKKGPHGKKIQQYFLLSAYVIPPATTGTKGDDSKIVAAPVKPPYEPVKYTMLFTPDPTDPAKSALALLATNGAGGIYKINKADENFWENRAAKPKGINTKATGSSGEVDPATASTSIRSRYEITIQ